MSDETLACRQKLPSLGRFQRDQFVSTRQPEFAHAGLVLARYLPCHDKESSGKRFTFEAACDALRRLARPGSDSIYSRVHDRWLQMTTDRGACSFSLATPLGARLIVGLGKESPLETGLTLHHTYGVPIIPGTALKGLAAHYCDQVFGQSEATLRRDHKTVRHDAKGKEVVEYGVHHFLFGNTDSSGFITFNDAWIDPQSLDTRGEGLLFDVMTSHHSDYYGEKRYDCRGQSLHGQLIPPTEFDDPVPVTFLSVRGIFHFTLSWNDGAPPLDGGAKQRSDWLAFTKRVLVAALCDWGIGGKTSSGYGRLVELTESKAVVTAEGAVTASNLSSVAGSGPRYDRGAKISVTCIEPAAGKKKAKFRADDGFSGHIASNEQPGVTKDQKIELWVANVSGQGYTLSTTEVVVKQHGGQQKPGSKRHK